MRLINAHFWKFFVGLAALIILGISVIVIAQKYQLSTQDPVPESQKANY